MSWRVGINQAYFSSNGCSLFSIIARKTIDFGGFSKAGRGHCGQRDMRNLTSGDYIVQLGSLKVSNLPSQESRGFADFSPQSDVSREKRLLNRAAVKLPRPLIH